MRTLITALAITAGLAGPALAHEARLGELTIGHPWSRPVKAANGAAYLSISNAGSQPDRLIAASSDVATRTELHTHLIDADGVARMRQVQAVDVPADGTVSLQPGGLHIMLFGLREPLQAGSEFPLTLTFEHAGSVTVEVAVEMKPSHGGTDGEHASH
ncbi:MAG: copper chaperone PCu(A)C [Geminicoccaceae bacterium]